jgi:hypothetical protein
MNDNFIHLKDRLTLEQARTYLEQLPVHAGVLEEHLHSHPTLLVTLPEGISLNISYLPLPEDHFEDIRLMQFYALLVSGVNEVQRTELVQLLNEINVICPIGAFYVDDQGELAYKYIFPVPRFELPVQGAFLDLFTLFRDCLLNFKDILTGLTGGTVDLAGALRSLTNE